MILDANILDCLMFFFVLRFNDSFTISAALFRQLGVLGLSHFLSMRRSAYSTHVPKRSNPASYKISLD